MRSTGRRNRKSYGKSMRKQNISVEVNSARSKAELFPLYLSALGTTLLGVLAIYAAFFSPLKDAFQAELKNEALSAKQELEASRAELREIERTYSVLKEELENNKSINSLQLAEIEQRKTELKSIQSEFEKQKNDTQKLQKQNKKSSEDLRNLLKTIENEKINRAFSLLDRATASALSTHSVDNLGNIFSMKGVEEHKRGMIIYLELYDLVRNEAKDLNIRDRYPSSADRHWEQMVKMLDLNFDEHSKNLPSYDYETAFLELSRAFKNVCEAKFRSIKFIFTSPSPQFVKTHNSTQIYKEYLDKLPRTYLNSKDGIKEYEEKVQSINTTYEKQKDEMQIAERMNVDRAKTFSSEFEAAVALYSNRLKSMRIECLSQIKPDFVNYP